MFITSHRVIVNDEDLTPFTLFDNMYKKTGDNVSFDHTTSMAESTSSVIDYCSLSPVISKDAALIAVDEMVSITSELSETIMDFNVLSKTMEEQEDRTVSLSAMSKRHPTPLKRLDIDGTDAIILKLVESPTFFLFHRPSETADRRTTEGEIVERDNTRYEYLTIGQGRNRKVASVQVQTPKITEQTRSALAEYPHHKDIGVMADPGDIFDNVRRIDIVTLGQEQDELIVHEDISETVTQILSAAECDAAKPVALSHKDQIERIVQSVEFKDAVARVEKVLASNTYHMQQKLFQSSIGQNPFEENVEFPYRLEYLWAFSCDTVKGRTVTALCWNCKNKDILAVGYGKFHFTDVRNGMVCCWSVKNPCRPDREYKFDSTVTSIDFSKDRPNLISVGLYDGTVVVLDVVTREKNVIAQSCKTSSPSCEPVWKVSWHKGEEYVFACCQDGRIFRLRSLKDFSIVPLMHVTRHEGKVAGIEPIRKCKPPEIPVSRYSAALTITRHPTNPLWYYVGTDEGCVLKCSTNYLYYPLETFMAHDGPIYAVKISPFCPELLLTCGADCYLRIWADGITEPLITLSASTEAVLDASWSPTHGTVLASISGSDVFLWDINRKTRRPVSRETSPSSHRNTVISFSSSGYNLLVGDSGGSIHVYALTGMPFAYHVNQPYIFKAILANIGTKPELLAKVVKISEKYIA